jgi:hypothetical protein
VTGRRSGRLKITTLDDVHSKWECTLLAPDPLKYALDAQTAMLSIGVPPTGLAPPWTPPVALPARSPGADRVTVTNAGTYETKPTIRLDGPGQDLQIINDTTGLNLAYDVVLGLGDYLLIDCNAGVALLNGTAVRAPLAGSSVTAQFVIEPGPNDLRFLGTATSPDMVAIATVTFNSAWD